MEPIIDSEYGKVQYNIESDMGKHKEYGTTSTLTITVTQTTSLTLTTTLL